jgi:hypothetical protein
VGSDSKATALVKSISAFCFILLAIGVFAAWNSPAINYESSIYVSTPLIFWFTSAISITSGVVMIIVQVSNRHTRNSNAFILVPSLLIFLAFTAILGLFIIRGYGFWVAGDPLTHLGEIQNVIRDGQVNVDSIYPATHIYLAEFSEICEIPLLTLAKLVPLFFGLLSVPFTYCLAKAILPAKGQFILTAVLSMTFITSWFLNLTPNALANLMFPLVLFLMVKSLAAKEAGWNVLLIMLIILYPTFHPIPTLVLLLILVSMFVSNLFNRRRSRIFPDYGSVFKFSSRNSVFLLVWSVTWISSHTVWRYEISRMYDLLIEGGQSKLGDLLGQINHASSYNYSVSEMFVKTYGGLSILIIVTIISGLALWKNRQHYSIYKYLFLFITPLALIIVAMILLFVGNLDFSPLRLLVYIVILAMLFCGFAMFEMVRKKKPLAVSFVIVITLFLFVTGILQLYPSKYILSSNYQITYSDIKGMDWFLRKKDENKAQTTFSITIFRYADLLLTSDEKNGRLDVRRYLAMPEELIIPWHFGYDKGNELGRSFSRDLYLVLHEQDRATYRDIFPEMAEIRLLTEDFDQLENDKSVDRLYTSGSLESYYIRGLMNSE